MMDRETDIERPAECSPGPLRLFVYGTLKQGFWNHDTFCQGALYIEQAKVRGRLYSLPSGIPVLKVPDNDILAVGTSDVLADLATQERFSDSLPVGTDCDETWQMIHGELIVFPYPQSSLPPIDRLESYRPGRFSLYRRVLVPATTSGGIVAAWTYTGSDEVIHHCLVTDRSAWP